MAIRFPCPACRQPIEVDDNWADQSVGCPYCRNVVNAPARSSWPPAGVPVASPARGAFAPPPPPPGYPREVNPASASPLFGTSADRPAGAGPTSAAWALMLSLFTAAVSVVGAMIWSFGLFAMATKEVGKDATQEQLQKVAQEIMLKGAAPVSPGAVTALTVGIFCGIAALSLAVRSLVGNERQHVKAVAAFLIAAMFVVCQALLVLVIFQRGGAH